MTKVSLLGAGNLATHLFKAFNKSDYVTVVQWFNRTVKSVSSYANEVEVTDDITTLKEADLYIIAVSDDAVAELSEKLPFENRLVVHTSGSVGIHDLDRKQRRGVFYPLQTFSKAVDIDFSEVPICIETIEKKDLQILKDLADSLGCKNYKINSEQRQTLHLAAVFVNNFANQLYRIGHEITDIKNIPFDILKPLILETAKKVQTISPYMAQTGPAKRNDKKTIKRHLKVLDNPMHKALYEMLTQSIQETHGRKKL